MSVLDRPVRRRQFLGSLAGMTVGGVFAPHVLAGGLGAASKPNLIVILSDDQGYQDLGCYGHPTIKTPRIDQMADEGMKFTDFYAGASICSPARACLLTGSYGARVGIYYSIPAGESLNPDEYTIAEMLKAQGYSTCLIGKKHLGPRFSQQPGSFGFDKLIGIQANSTTRVSKPTIDAINYINENKGAPFFLFVSHFAPHVPLQLGSYRGEVEALDRSTGQILDAVDAAGIASNTLVIYYSDNGPWLDMGADGGSALPLREGKFYAFEGGHRVPCIMRWPGVIPSGKVCREMASALDIFPTMGRIVGAKMPVKLRMANGTERPWVLDGQDIFPLLSGSAGASPQHKPYFYYQLWKDILGAKDYLAAVRFENWKLFPYQRALVDLSTNISENNNSYSAHPDIVSSLRTLFNDHQKDIIDNGRPLYYESNPPARYTPVLGELVTGVAGYSAVGGRRAAGHRADGTYDLRGRLRGLERGARGAVATPTGTRGRKLRIRN